MKKLVIRVARPDASDSFLSMERPDHFGSGNGLNKTRRDNWMQFVGTGDERMLER